MKRIFTILIFALALANTSFAQIANGSIAPDFTATDINGNTYNLYELLDQGKSVILDVSATWCGPCWSYHTTGVLEDVWETYGPDGTDEMYVFMIEGDASTGQADLEGTTSQTQGNWIEGTGYPIIDSPDIANAYEITYYPTLFHICPNKIVTEVGQVSLADHYEANNECPAWIFGENNVGVASYSGTSSIDCGTTSTVSPQVTIRNMGNSNLTSCVVEFIQDDVSVQSVEWTGDLTTLETADVAFEDVTVENFSEFTFALSMPNGASDEADTDNSLTQPIGASVTSSTSVTFEITTDFWPEEVTWQLTDANGDVLFSDADEGTLSCDETYTQTYALVEGECYTFAVQDGYGDGILNGPINPGAHSCGTENGIASTAMGSISLSSSEGQMWEDIDYGSGFELEFFVSTSTSIAEVELEELSIYPNPATNKVSVAFELAESNDLEIGVVNMLGQKVTSTGTLKYAAGKNNVDINTSALANGMYFVSIREGNKITSKKISILK